jgi:pyruvate dehydrogenase E2 component (dihydrolipoamide acetyltransferase)
MSFSPTEQEPSATAGTVEVTLPDLAGSVLEAIVVCWEKHPGEWVEQDEPICIVSADGVRAAIASSASGYLVRLLAGVGARIVAGTSLAEIAAVDPQATVGPTEPEPEPVELLPEPEAEAVEALPEPEPEPEPEPVVEPEEIAERDAAFAPLGARRGASLAEPEPFEMSAFHSPAVKRLVDEHGIDLSLVAGTGLGGRVRKEDVLAHLEALASAVAEEAAAEDTPRIRAT